MASNIQFNNANITNYTDLPTSIYPVLNVAVLTQVAINHATTNVINNVLPDNLGTYVTWQYPVTDDLYYRIAVGYQLQVMEGTFTDEQCQAYLPPGNIVYEDIVNLKTEPIEEDRYINLQGGAKGSVNIPPTTILAGFKYTVRIRALLFSELGDGTVGDQYFKYSKWGMVNFRINNVPTALNLQVNGSTNPTAIPKNDHVYFSFTFLDTDGPSYFYRVQVGTIPGVGFAANIWDSNVISAGAGFGSKDVTVSYSGSAVLSSNVTYAWRVWVSDGLSTPGWTAATDTFKINSLPTISTLKINGQEILFGATPTVGSTGAVLSWTFSDADVDAQKAYSLTVVQKLANSQPGSTSSSDAVDVQEILVTGNVFNSTSTLALPTLPEGGEIEVSLKVRDSIEFGDLVTAEFKANASPQVLSLKIDSKVNPGDVSSATPTFSWVFFDSSPGDIQVAFRIQVATNDTFASLLWDTGNITSAVNTVQYGTTAGPIVGPIPLTHGAYYYVRVAVSDGVSFSTYTNGFFAVNGKPNSPTILTPAALSYSGIINVTWLPAAILDPDGDVVTYTLEMTTRLSSNQGWEYLAGPLASGVALFALDTANIKAGNDYGVRILANDGFTDSNPTAGTSLGFTINNHNPTSPIFVSPKTGDIAGSILTIEWLEGNPVDVDGDAVFYILEITRDSSVGTPTYEKIGVYNQGTTRCFIDISNMPDGSSYKLRVTAQDDKKDGIGTTNYSGVFSIINTPAITDFETLGTTLYLSTTDGRIFKANESIWEFEEQFTSLEEVKAFSTFVRGTPVVDIENGALVIKSPPGSTYILKVGN